MENERILGLLDINFNFFESCDIDHYFIGQIYDKDSAQIKLFNPLEVMEVDAAQKSLYSQHGIPKQFTIATNKVATGNYLFKLYRLNIDKKGHIYGLAIPILRIGNCSCFETGDDDGGFAYRLTISALAKSRRFICAYHNGICGDMIIEMTSTYTIYNKYGNKRDLYGKYGGSDCYTKMFNDLVDRKISFDDDVHMVSDPSEYQNMIIAYIADRNKDNNIYRIGSMAVDLNKYTPGPVTRAAMDSYIRQAKTEHGYGDDAFDDADLEAWLYRQDRYYFNAGDGDESKSVVERIEEARLMRNANKERNKIMAKRRRAGDVNG